MQRLRTPVPGHFSPHFALPSYELFAPFALWRLSVSLQPLVHALMSCLASGAPWSSAMPHSSEGVGKQQQTAMLIYQKYDTSLFIYFYFFGAKTQDSWVAAVSPPARQISRIWSNTLTAAGIGPINKQKRKNFPIHLQNSCLAMISQSYGNKNISDSLGLLVVPNNYKNKNKSSVSP